MKKIYKWMRVNKIISGVVIATIVLLVLNVILIAQFVSILNVFI